MEIHGKSIKIPTPDGYAEVAARRAAGKLGPAGVLPVLYVTLAAAEDEDGSTAAEISRLEAEKEEAVHKEEFMIAAGLKDKLSELRRSLRPAPIQHCFSQSSAILRFVGRFTLVDDLPLYPVDDPISQIRVDQVDEALAEIKARLLPAWYKAAQPRSLITGQPSVLLSESQQEELIMILNEDILPSKLLRLEKLLEKSAPASGTEHQLCDGVSCRLSIL